MKTAKIQTGVSALACLLASMTLGGCVAPPNPHAPAFAQRSCVKPQYPAGARARNEKGVTALKFSISPEGWVTKVDVAKSSGSAELDQAAIAALYPCRFRPMKESAHGVDVHYNWSM